MRAEQPHRLPGRDPHRRQAEPLHEAVDDAVRGLARMDHPRGDAERPGRGRHQKRAGAFRLATSRRRRACPRSAGRRSRRPARAAAPRPAPSAPGPPWSRANRRAGNPRCRRGRRNGRGCSRPAAGRGRRCAPRRPRRAMPRPAAPAPASRPAAHRARQKPARPFQRPDWTRSSDASGSGQASPHGYCQSISAGAGRIACRVGRLPFRCAENRPSVQTDCPCRGPALLFHSACSLLSRKYKAPAPCGHAAPTG